MEDKCYICEGNKAVVTFNCKYELCNNCFMHLSSYRDSLYIINMKEWNKGVDVHIEHLKENYYGRV